MGGGGGTRENPLASNWNHLSPCSEARQVGRKEGMVEPPSSVSAVPASTPKVPEPALHLVLIEIPETSCTSQSARWYLLRLNFLVLLRFGIGVVVPSGSKERWCGNRRQWPARQDRPGCGQPGEDRTCSQVGCSGRLCCQGGWGTLLGGV